MLALALAFAAGVRWRLREIPLERDEGEYAYNAQLLLDGVPPFQAAHATQKLPGTAIASALALAAWPELPAGLRLGLWAANALSTVLLFALVRRAAGSAAAATAAAVFAVLSLAPGSLGFAAHATHFVVLFALAGLAVLDRTLRRERASEPLAGVDRIRSTSSAGSLASLAASGALFGLSILARQPSVVFALFGCAQLAISDRRASLAWSRVVRRGALFSAGVVAPYALLATWLACAGSFPTFWFWTATYAREYGSRVSAAEALASLRQVAPGVFGGDVALWIVAVAGLALGLVRRDVRSAWLAGWVCASALAIGAGGYFRNHYFIQLVPVAATCCGAFVAGPVLGARAARRWLAAASVAVAVAVAASLWLHRDYLFADGPRAISRSVYRGNPFVEVEIAGRELRARSQPGDTIAVLGSEPQLYAYSRLRAATKYVYTYALMEDSPFAARFQDEMIAEIEAARPRFVVVAALPLSWLVGERSERRILAWAEAFLAREYRRIGVLELERPARWDDAARVDPPQGAWYLAVFERRASAAPGGR